MHSSAHTIGCQIRFLRTVLISEGWALLMNSWSRPYSWCVMTSSTMNHVQYTDKYLFWKCLKNETTDIMMSMVATLHTTWLFMPLGTVNDSHYFEKRRLYALIHLPSVRTIWAVLTLILSPILRKKTSSCNITDSNSCSVNTSIGVLHLIQIRTEDLCIILHHNM